MGFRRSSDRSFRAVLVCSYVCVVSNAVASVLNPRDGIVMATFFVQALLVSYVTAVAIERRNG